MDKLLLKALGTTYRKLYPIDPVLTPRMQVLLLRIAAAEARPSRCLERSVGGGRPLRATS
jgi:hypothetical protein